MPILVRLEGFWYPYPIRGIHLNPPFDQGDAEGDSHYGDEDARETSHNFQNEHWNPQSFAAGLVIYDDTARLFPFHGEKDIPKM